MIRLKTERSITLKQNLKGDTDTLGEISGYFCINPLLIQTQGWQVLQKIGKSLNRPTYDKR